MMAIEGRNLRAPASRRGSAVDGSGGECCILIDGARPNHYRAISRDEGGYA